MADCNSQNEGFDIISQMSKPNRLIVWLLILITLVVFGLYCIPNSRASENFAMVSMFEPDEGAIYTVVDRQTLPRGDWTVTFHHFINYAFYHYGFPFFGSGALLAFPLRWTGQFGNTPLLMTVLRQGLNVLPSLIAFLLLVWMQDGFRTYRSLVLYLLLIILPASLRNSLWIHPDGLVLLLAVLILFCLWKDQSRFGKHFRWAAALCGVLTATKLVGVYFFLAILVLLTQALQAKQLTLKTTFRIGLTFLTIMGLAFLFSNPFVFNYPSLRLYGFTLKREFLEITGGYGLVYETGLKAAWPTMRQNFGELAFLMAALMATIWGAVKGKDKLLHQLTLTWFIPLTLLLLTISHFKYQYWLPVAVPVISNVILFFPKKMTRPNWQSSRTYVGAVGIIIVLLQAALFVGQDVRLLNSALNRAVNNPIINFYEQSLSELQPLDGKDLKVYYDYRLYVPDTPDWKTETSFGLLQPADIETGDYDILLLLRQRVLDYLNPDAVAINPDQLETSRVFYQAVMDDTLPGYERLYSDETGFIFVRQLLCEQNFPGGSCR